MAKRKSTKGNNDLQNITQKDKDRAARNPLQHRTAIMHSLITSNYNENSGRLKTAQKRNGVSTNVL